MISRAVVCPGAPLLIPGLADGLRAEVPDLVAAVDSALGRLRSVDRIVLLTSGPRARDEGQRAQPGSVVHPDGTLVSSALLTGTSGPVQFSARLSGPPPNGRGGTPPGVGVIVGAALLDGAGVEAPVTAVDLADDHPAEVFDLLATANASADRVGLLVIADGSANRGPDSPGGDSLDATRLDRALATALGTGHRGDLHRVAEVARTAVARMIISSGPALLALADLPSSAPDRAELLFHDAPLGVGYFVAVWSWAELDRPCSATG